MVTFAIGNIGTFDDGVETFEDYAERLQQYYLANEKASTKSFEELIDHLNRHLNPKPLVIAERSRFHKRDQKQGETIIQYIAGLRNLRIHCNFGDYLGDALRYRFVCGLRNEKIQKILISKDLTLGKAVKTAVAMETATYDAIELQGQRNQQTVNTIHKKTPTPKSDFTHKTAPTKPCFLWEGDHKLDKCRHINTICRFCSNTGVLKGRVL